MTNEIKDIVFASSKRDEIMEQLVEYITNIVESKGYQELNQVEVNIYNVGMLVKEVDKGGFGHYFKTTQGNLVDDILDFLQSIEEFNIYNLLNQANRIFHSNFDEEDKMDEYTEIDEEYFELEDELWEYYGKCIKYVKDNIVI